MAKYFGTDGIRGRANLDLDVKIAFKIGRFLGYYYKSPRVLIGKDTRRSGYMLEYAIASGLCASGGNAYLMHVCTTPSVAHIVKAQGFDLGIMITASHNPYTDNGIKILDKNGEKLSEKITDLIEEYIDLKDDKIPLATDEKIGIIYDYESGKESYIDYLTSVGKPLAGYKIGLDLANGSCYDIAKRVFSSLGAEILVIGNKPNGLNINEGCGSTHIDSLCTMVKEKGLDFGFAFDGDGDRCMAVDEGGCVVDGDKIIYLLARGLKEKNELRENTVVLTVMSNSGIISSLGKIGIDAQITAVGDRNVSEKMNELNLSLGGEQSGHIIIKKHASTGDGILTAIMVANEIVSKKMALSDLCRDAFTYPQKTRSVHVKNKQNILKNSHVLELLEKINTEICGNGRVLLRASGTENVIRIMVECESNALCDNYIKQLESVICEVENA